MNINKLNKSEPMTEEEYNRQIDKVYKELADGNKRSKESNIVFDKRIVL